MSQQMILPGFGSAISSPALADGRLPCASQAGPTIGPSGRVAAPASRSALQESGQASETNGTYGQPSPISSRSVALCMSLGSRLQARLGTGGSMEYDTTWKLKGTSSGLPYWVHSASGRRISGKGFSGAGWPTPNLPTGGPNSKRAERKAGGQDLEEIAASVAGWPTPRSEDSEQTGAHRGSPDTLTSAGRVAGWSTPRSNEYKSRKPGTGGAVLQELAEMVTPGATPSGSPAGTAGPAGSGAESHPSLAGSLNPALPRWLMGFPPEWDAAAIAAWRKLQAQRRGGRRRKSLTPPTAPAET